MSHPVKPTAVSSSRSLLPGAEGGARPKRRVLSVAAGLLAVCIAGAPIASAQFSRDVFFDWTLLQSQAIGFELIRQRLFIFESVAFADRDVGFEEAIEAMAESDFQRFAGTLGMIDAELAEELYWVLDGIVSSVENGPPGVARALVPIAKILLEDAYDLVVPAAIRNDPAFRAGIMTQLLLAESSVAEGLEEAFTERWAFANGWAATQQVRAMWQDIAGLATPEQAAEVEAALAAFDQIYPSPLPPASLAGIDPEEAETPAQRMVGFLETIVDAQLYSGRDQLRLINYLRQLATGACALYQAAGNDYAGFEERAFQPGTMMQGDQGAAEIIFGPADVGRELMYAVGDHYASETTGLGELIGLFNPPVHAAIMAGLTRLIEVELRPANPTVGQLTNPPAVQTVGTMVPRAACQDVIVGLAVARHSLE